MGCKNCGKTASKIAGTRVTPQSSSKPKKSSFPPMNNSNSSRGNQVKIIKGGRDV